MTARQDNAVKAAIIHQLRDKWWTPEEAATALNLPLSTVQHWWSTDVERMTWWQSPVTVETPLSGI